MRVLVVDGFTEPSNDPGLAARVVSLLEAQHHDVESLSLAGAEYAGFMTAEERHAYETDEPLIDPAMKRSAQLVQSVDALVFVYPTTLFGVPPVVKSWLERVMVLGVAFVFDDSQRVRPGLTNVRRLGVVTTTRHNRRRIMRARDLGYRTFMRTLRLNCHPLCRRTFIRLGAGAPQARFADRLHRSLRTWR